MGEEKEKVIHSAAPDDEEDPNTPYNVVTDIEERYSIWPADQNIPKFWKLEGFSGTKEECLNYIQRTWTDMRPLSLRLEMAKYEAENKRKQPDPEFLKRLEEEREKAIEEGIDYFNRPQPPNEFVKKLMKPQPVVIIRYRNRETGEPEVKKLTSAVSRGYVLVKFPFTQGGTELGASLDTTGDGKPDPGHADYSVPGKLSIKGRLKLDYTPVMLHATIDLETFEGIGYLEVIPNWKTPHELRNEERLKEMQQELREKREKERLAALGQLQPQEEKRVEELK